MMDVRRGTMDENEFVSSASLVHRFIVHHENISFPCINFINTLIE